MDRRVREGMGRGDGDGGRCSQRVAMADWGALFVGAWR